MKIIGHRGALGLAPENTLAAIKKALEYKVDEIEIDARVTLDNVAVLGHDDRINDASGKFVSTKETNYATLLNHKPDLTKLEDVFAVLPKSTVLCIEIKARVNPTAIINVIKTALSQGVASTQINVASFSLSVLKQVHHELPDIKLVINERWSGVRGSHRARKFHTDRLNMYQKWLWAGYVKPLAKRGMKIYAFTVNQPDRGSKLVNMGVEGLITDYPDRFIKA